MNRLLIEAFKRIGYTEYQIGKILRKGTSMEDIMLKLTIGDTTLGDTAQYASIKHRHQRRKNGDPYVYHPLRVYLRLKTPYDNAENTVKLTMFKGALLHDILEDTDTQKYDLSYIFGSDVADIVEELTIPKKVTTEEKGDYLAEHIKEMSPIARSIKLSDRLDNVKELKFASPAFTTRYVGETEKLINSARTLDLDSQEKSMLSQINDSLDLYR